ncbi:MAG: hypothetical protein NC213_10425 [Acetobacter sp.]|nr:hypothetical protein [Bacteroides sp.]MCM1342150.1 hypothetical protein [Acetobacter sp.]MCM1434378.1 hypothetical protein [Clostridiales bacterium]
MKKAVLALTLISVIFFTGCSKESILKKTITPELPVSFNQRANVSSGDFSYSCEICKNDKSVSVKVTSTNAQGMVMIYDGSNMVFNYNDMIGETAGGSLPQNNIAIVIYDAYTVLLNDKSAPSKVDAGYKYQNKISLGDFVLIMDNDMRLKSFSMKSMDLKVEFY